MSPEQLEGGRVDRTTDVWALGVTLWELLAGRRLFRRETASQTIAAVLNGAIVHPSALEPSVPADLDAIVLRALARDPTARYPTAREMGRELAAGLHDDHLAASLGENVGQADAE